jgi:hypothetical protein
VLGLVYPVMSSGSGDSGEDRYRNSARTFSPMFYREINFQLFSTLGIDSLELRRALCFPPRPGGVRRISNLLAGYSLCAYDINSY